MKFFLTMLIPMSLLATLVQAQTTGDTAIDSKTEAAVVSTTIVGTDSQSRTAIKRDKISAGVGLGIDYSDFGAGVTIYPLKYIGVFANAGIFLAGPSYSVGLRARYITKSRIDPYLSLQYGCGGSVIILDNDGHIDKDKTKLFISPNIGAGVDIHITQTLFITSGVTVSSAFPDIVDYRNELKEDYDFGNSIILPVSISVGLKWRIY